MQRYSVKLYPEKLEKLEALGCVHKIGGDLEIRYLDPEFYSSEYGVLNKEID